MEDVQKAQGDLAVIAPASGEVAPPKSIDEVIAGLRGFGIEELEEILTIKTKSRDVRLKISNIPTTDEMLSIQATEDLKGYLWIKRVKVEILSRAISWIDGCDLRALPKDKRFVTDPTDGQVKDVQAALRNLLLSWGQELVEILWKVLMTHSQNIEDRMKNQFPDSAIMTEVEQRLFEQAKQFIDERNQIIVDETVSQLYDEAAESLPETTEEPKK